MKNNTKADILVGSLAVYVAEKVKAIWQAVSISTVSGEIIVKMIRSHNDKYMNMKKFVAKKQTVKMKSNLQNFKSEE